MDTDIYVLNAFYCGFCSIRHQPLDQNDVPDYLARRVQMKPRVQCTIHGDICGFVVTTAKARAFPAAVINGYIALNNAAHTVAVRHCETDHFLAGYRFFSFNTTQEQDYFIQYLDTILDSHVSMFKRNSAFYYNYSSMRGGPSGSETKPSGAYRFPYRQMQYLPSSPLPTKVQRPQQRVSDSSRLYIISRPNRMDGGLNIHKRRHCVF